MADDEVVYETKTVKAVRGMESRTAAKRERDGWEVVSQTQGKLNSELVLRRPKPKSRTLLWIAGGATLAVILGTIITIGALTSQNAPAEAEPQVSETTSSEPSEPADDESAAPSEYAEPSEEPLVATITTENNVEFASILALTDYCSADIAAFAADHAGEQIEFDGNVGTLNNQDGATTRYDILLGAGDYSETAQPGPAFQFRDVNLTTDLHYTAKVPDTIGVGDELHIIATVDQYEESSCLFLIEPVETSFR